MEMEMRKVLIADSSEEFTEALSAVLRGSCFIRVVSSGVQALEQLRVYRPDVLVLDLMLPELDGISLLQVAAAENLVPCTIAVTRFASPYVTDAIARFGASYVMLKPCDIDGVAARVRDLAEQARRPVVAQPDMRNTVSNVLISLRVPTKLRGYGCAREAVLCLMRNPDMSITKELYPAVASICDGNAAQVERAIRGAINAAWTHQNEVAWRKYFQPCADGTIPRPSNAEFLLRIVDQLTLEQDSPWEPVGEK